MIHKQAQIKINLPLKLKKKIEKRAGEYDLTMAGYLKYLVVNDLKDIPTYEPSDRALRSLKAALRDEKKGRLLESV